MNKNRKTEQPSVPDYFFEAVQEIQAETKGSRLNQRHSYEDKRKRSKQKDRRDEA